jgi:hypothetical protein
LQACAAGQALPQLLQLAALVRRSTQEEPQSVIPIPQLQLPLLQVSGAVHVVPQTPQLSSSVSRSAHTPVGPVPHGVSPDSQPQPPVLQVSGRVHTVPQVPQLSASFNRSAQMPTPQLSPSVQPQALLMHTCGEVQRLPQAPQLFESVSQLTHIVLLQTI